MVSFGVVEARTYLDNIKSEQLSQHNVASLKLNRDRSEDNGSDFCTYVCIIIYVVAITWTRGRCLFIARGREAPEGYK